APDKRYRKTFVKCRETGPPLEGVPGVPLSLSLSPPPNNPSTVGPTPLHLGVAPVPKRPMPGVAEAFPRRCQDAGGHEFASARSIPAGNTRFAGGFFSRVRVSGRADAALKRLPTRTVNSR